MQAARRMLAVSAWMAVVLIVAASAVLGYALLWRGFEASATVSQIGGRGICETSDYDRRGPGASGDDAGALVFRARPHAPLDGGRVFALIAKYEVVLALVVTPLFVFLLSRLVRKCMGDPSGWQHRAWR